MKRETGPSAPLSRLRARLLALFIGLFAAIPAAFPDDIDIYANAAPNPATPPMTIIVLDLNLLGICQNILVNGAATPNGTQGSNPSNTAAPQLCLNITSNMLLGEVLGGITSDPAALLETLLLGTGGSDAAQAQALCNLYGLLGIQSPVVQLPLVGGLLKILLGGVSTLSCSTLSFLLSIPLLDSILDGLLGGFVGQLVAGLIDPLLNTVVGQLPGTVVGLLNTTFSGVLNLGQVGLVSLLESILNQLINSRVAIMVSHADRANATGSPASSCAFGDLASIPTSRRETPNCSNGAYFLVGFTPLVDQGTVTQLLTRVTSLLVNTLAPSNLLNATTALAATALTTPTQLLPPYQGKEVYAEIAHYLSGDAVYNAPLARWDGLTGVLTRDKCIENGGCINGGSTYVKPEAVCRSVNVLTVQLTNNLRDNESDGRLRHYFPSADQNGAISLANLVKVAQDPGFVDGSGNAISLKSHFIVQENLSSLSALTGVGANVLTYANNLGLLNLGQAAADLMKPTLSVDASLVTPGNALDLSTPNTPREQVYFTGFRTPKDKKPRWPGNVKRLKRTLDAQGNYQYVDANNQAAISSAGGVNSVGRISENALTFWTRTGSALGSKSKDGGDVSLGGAGQQIPGYQYGGGGAPGINNAAGKRQLYYDSDSGSSGLSPLDIPSGAVDTALKAALGAADDATAKSLLYYARGYDVGSGAVPPSPVGRSWLHGAVLHSRPVAIDYGGSTPDLRVLYGAADGFLRMLRDSDGVESWGFMPQAVMPQQKILRDNAVTVQLPYGVDGAPAVLLRDRDSSGNLPGDGRIQSSNSHDKALVFFGLRRSGRELYALDVTNPDAPKLAWRLGPAGLFRSSGKVAGTDADYAQLGLSFSTPQIGRLRLQVSASTEEVRSVLLFAGGYNGGRDAAGSGIGKDAARGSAGTVGSDDGMGNALFIVDADNGELLWKAVKGSFDASEPYDETTRSFSHPLLADSIPSDVTAVDSDGDGFTDRLYVADSGGRLWRADFPGSDRAAWTLSPLASFGRHENNNVANDRRFFHAPDYVPFRDGTAIYDAVVLASGDREDPFNTTTENYLYAYRDSDVRSGKAVGEIAGTGVSAPAVKTHADFADLSVSCAAGSAGCAGSDVKLRTGWKIKLGDSGEKAVSQPLTTGGTVFLSSYVPVAATCEPSEGYGKLYGVSLKDSRPVVTQLIGDGDGDRRSTRASAAGLSGELTALPGDSVGVNAQNLGATTPRYQDIFWRERRNDEETQP